MKQLSKLLGLILACRTVLPTVLLAALLFGCSSEQSESIDVAEVLPNQPAIESSGSLDERFSSSETLTLPFVGGPIIFTEVDPVNLNYEDHEGDDAGWVELFNTSAEPVNLKGVSLTNSLAESRKWTFGDVTVPPQGFMLVYLSGKNLPDYKAPHDSANMIGPGCWSWTDAQNADIPGESYSEPLEGQKKLCFTEDGTRMFGARMRLGENRDLGWSSISSFIGTGSTDPEDVLDLSATNEMLIHAYITRDRQVSLRLVQTGVDDWKGYEIVLTGTGDSSTVYRTRIPTNRTFPDLKIIYGTRVSPESKEKEEVSVKIFSYIARNRGHEPHASFKIKNEPGTLYLVNASNEIMDQVSYPKVPTGKTWSIGTSSADGASLHWGFSEESPYGFTESTVVSERAPAMDTLSELPPSGFYQAPFAVFFSEEDYVRCEWDGTVPSENSPLTTVKSIEKTTVLRCASFVPGMFPGETINRTYVFESLPMVPVFFVTADPKSLFDPDSGIYMEGNNAEAKEPHYGANYWLDKEIPVFVELLETGVNQPAFAKYAGLKIFGNYSRQNKKKSVSITFREKYGDKRLNYPLFPEFPHLKKFKVFLLRNNGSNFGNDYIRDRLASSISEGLGVDYQHGRGSIVYYNGEYYGIHNIRERSTEYYFETNYGYDPENIDLLKADNSVSAGSSVEYERLMDWIDSHDMKLGESLDYVGAQMDLDNFMNYMHLELFVNNRDWPANNLKKWRCTNPETKWKWFIYDTDFGFGNDYSNYTNNIFEFATAEDGESWPNGPQSTFLLRKLLENQTFKTAFINRMATLLSMNFNSGRTLARINAMMSEIESEIKRDQKRWRLSSSQMESQLNSIKNFATERPIEILSDLQIFFNLGAVKAITLSVQGRGKIMVHNLPLDQNPMSVNFFTGTPVLLTAMPEAGSIWTGWSDGVMDESRFILPEDIGSLSAIFK
ncbi:MAG: CotH kinase family protein [Fibrobacter sp.]|nr:CotH kinase family protein [Fibrobacter sp.]